MTVHYLNGLQQHTDAWHEARRGIVTVSNLKHLVTPKTLAPSTDQKMRDYCNDLIAQVLTGHTEPSYASPDMQRGLIEEHDARAAYEEAYEATEQCGFVTNDEIAPGHLVGWSPDFLVGEDGCGEIKCPRGKTQIETILSNKMPADHLVQVQGGLLVSGRKWCDFVTHCAGLPMFTIRVHADPWVQKQLAEAIRVFYGVFDENMAKVRAMMESGDFRLVPTERRSYEITSSLNGGV